GKAVGQDRARAGFVDAAAAQVVDGVLIELAHGRAMGGDDVVGVDFQFRLGIDLGLLGQQQGIRGLLGIGFLCVLVNDDLAVEHAAAAAIQNTFEDFAAGAVRDGVIDPGVVVDVLAVVADEYAIQPDFGVLAAQPGVGVDTRQPPTEIETMIIDAAVALLVGEQHGHVVAAARGFFLQAAARELGIGVGYGLGHRVGEVGQLAHADIMLDDRGLAVFMQLKAMAHLCHALVLAAAGKRDHMQWFV